MQRPQTQKLPTRLANILVRAKNTQVAHLWLCQVIASELKKDYPKMNTYIFSKKCGYNYDITL